jgi:hypothetical protein
MTSIYPAHGDEEEYKTKDTSLIADSRKKYNSRN